MAYLPLHPDSHSIQSSTQLAGFAWCNPDKVRVSTIDAAQGQEADIVIISFVRANAAGNAGFTDDANRFNVAITRAKAGVIIVGHLATSLAASTSGFGQLLFDLRRQRAVYQYCPDSRQRLALMSAQDYKEIEQKFPPEVINERRRKKLEGKTRASQAAAT